MGSRPNWGALLLLCCAIGVAFLPVVLGRESLYHLDRFFEHEPFWRFVARSVRAGEWPLWTPHIRAGYPLHANGEASLFYPLTLPLALALPAHRALDAFALLHLVALGFFTWLYLREIGVQPALALSGAVAFALSGQMVASTIWAHAVAASACLPLVLLGVERARRGGRGASALVAAGVALGCLAGRPQRFLPAMLFAGGYALCVLLAVPDARAPAPAVRARRLAALGLAAALGLCVAAIQVLPTALFVADSPFGEGVDRAVFTAASLRSWSFASAFLPERQTDLIANKCYPGVAVALGVLIGLVGAARQRGFRQPRALFFGVSGAAMLYVAFAGPGAYELCQAIPGLRSIRAPGRFLFPASFAAVAFACLAWSRLLAGRGARPAWALAALVAVDLVLVARLTAPTASPRVYELRPDAADRLLSEPPDAIGAAPRFYAETFWIWPRELAGRDDAQLARLLRRQPPTQDLALRYGLYAADGYGEPQFAWQRPLLRAPRRAFLDQLGARTLFLKRPLPDVVPRGRSGRARVFENPHALPRALVVTRLAVAADAREAARLAAAPGFDRRRTAVVERPALAASAAPAATAGSVRLVSESPTRLELMARSDAPAWLLLFDTWAPGWRARVDGRDVPILRANGTFRLVALPAGASTVRFDYRPPGFAVGGVLSAAGTLVLLALLAHARRQPPARPLP